MERVGIGVICYGAREAAMVDAFSRSPNYSIELYIIDKQRNPFNARRAEVHEIVPDLNVETIVKIIGRYRDKIDFVIPGSEGPILAGIRNRVEQETKVPVVCPTKEYTLEGSKVRQRLLLKEIAPEVNPRFKIFDPTDYKGNSGVIEDVQKWIRELGGVERAVIKPDKPGFGKGVAVGGEHFTTIQEAIAHFNSIYGGETREKVIIEENIEGEESSFQCFCDGKRIMPLPDVRDYKRAYDEDTGPNTGSMGSYMDRAKHLPFMSFDDKDIESELVLRVFNKLKRGRYNPNIIGMPFYTAFTHTKRGRTVIFEFGDRPGDPEGINTLVTLDDDFVDVCFGMLNGNLKRINLQRKATVATYLTPDVYPAKDNKIRKVDLSGAYRLHKKYGDNIRIYPASMELRDGETYALTSRTVCVVGIDDDIQGAREISLKGIKAIKGDSLRHRRDIASEGHIAKSIAHMEKLRQLN